MIRHNGVIEVFDDKIKVDYAVNKNNNRVELWLENEMSSTPPIIEDEPIEKEWFDIEKELLFSELRTYYIKRTEEQLRDSYDYFIKRPGSNQRISIINECAKIKQLE